MPDKPFREGGLVFVHTKQILLIMQQVKSEKNSKNLQRLLKYISKTEKELRKNIHCWVVEVLFRF